MRRDDLSAEDVAYAFLATMEVDDVPGDRLLGRRGQLEPGLKCSLRRKRQQIGPRLYGRDYALERPELIALGQALPAYPTMFRMMMRARNIPHFVWAHRAEPH